MTDMTEQNPNSHLTAIDRDNLSYPLRVLLKENLILGKILDYGCGKGTDFQKLRQKGLDATGYDPFYFPEFPKDKFDTIICFYVLNVLLPEEQNDVLMKVSCLLKPNGKAFFAVRRDVKYEGFRTHKIHLKQTYQRQVRLNYKSVFRNENCEIYQYQHYNVLNKGNAVISPFFTSNEITLLLAETENVFAILDKYPVAMGHTLIIPKTLIPNYFDLTFDIQKECWEVMNFVKRQIQEHYNPDGFNVGININRVAGQTVDHCHIHLIPRYKNDVPNPRGGIRGVIPNKKEY